MATLKKHKRIDWTAWLRRLSQFGFLAFIVVAAVRSQLSTVTTPSVDAICPFGGIETLWTWIASGGTAYIPKTHLSNLVLLVGLLLGAVLAGGAFCGWICPFGALQDALAWVRRKLRLPELRVPAKVDRFLRFGRYLVLGGVLYATISTATLWFADIDPFRTIFSLRWLFEFDLATQWIGLTVAGVILIGSLFIPRLWCRYLCPLGGILGLLQRISPLKVRRDSNLCINCGKCDKSCPMKLEIATQPAVNYNCTSCAKCTTACPVPGALTIGLPEVKLGRPEPVEVEQ